MENRFIVTSINSGIILQVTRNPENFTANEFVSEAEAVQEFYCKRDARIRSLEKQIEKLKAVSPVLKIFKGNKT